MVREFIRVMGEMTAVLPALRYRMPEDSDKTSLGRVFENTVARFPDNTKLIFEGRQWTYREFNAELPVYARPLFLRVQRDMATELGASFWPVRLELPGIWFRPTLIFQ